KALVTASRSFSQYAQCRPPSRCLAIELEERHRSPPRSSQLRRPGPYAGKDVAPPAPDHKVVNEPCLSFWSLGIAFHRVIPNEAFLHFAGGITKVGEEDRAAKFALHSDGRVFEGLQAVRRLCGRSRVVRDSQLIRREPAFLHGLIEGYGLRRQDRADAAHVG